MHTQAQIDTILQAHVLHRFVRYAIVIAPRRVEFGSALLCSVLFLLVRFSVQFNFFYIFQFQVRCLSLLACCYCFFILRLEEGLEQLRLIDFFLGSSIFAVFDSWCWSKQFNKPLEAIERVFLRFQIEEFDTKENSVYRKLQAMAKDRRILNNKSSWNEFQEILFKTKTNSVLKIKDDTIKCPKKGRERSINSLKAFDYITCL